MPPRKAPPPAAPRNTFRLKAWPPTVEGEGWGLPVAFLGVVVVLIMALMGIDKVVNGDLKITVRMVQEAPAPLEKPPPFTVAQPLRSTPRG